MLFSSVSDFNIAIAETLIKVFPRLSVLDEQYADLRHAVVFCDSAHGPIVSANRSNVILDQFGLPVV
jgi:hypothetical protein